MKTSIKILIIINFLSIFFISCEKENEEGELDMQFKTENGYTFTDATLPNGTAVKIGIEAETEVEKDPIIKFNISESVNNEAAATIYSEDLEDVDFEYDYDFILSDTVSGNTHEYTFTIVNRDGINAQKSLTITIE